MTPVDINPQFPEAKFQEMISLLASSKKRFLNFETIHQHKDDTFISVEIFLQFVSRRTKDPCLFPLFTTSQINELGIRRYLYRPINLKLLVSEARDILGRQDDNKYE